MSAPKIIEEFEGKLWISSDHHIDAVTKAYESGKAVGAKAERVKWEPVITAVIREVPWQLRGSEKGNAPGHAHEIAGIWDSDNGALAGTECAWCKAWNTAKAAIREREQA
jgi:hypothetical protein